MQPRLLVLLVLALWSVAASADGVDLLVQLPDGQSAQSGTATASGLKLQTAGRPENGGILFPALLPDTPYDLQIVLADGTMLCGADLAWYNPEPPKPDAGALTDDDRAQIRSLVADVRQFYDRSEILLLQGDHDRAVGLIQQVRDSQFHSGRGDEVIWRVEVWYFRNRHGGWERVSQQNRVLRRERFPSRQAFRQEAERLRWVAELGGIRLAKESGRQIIQVQIPSPAMPAAAGR